MDPPEEVEDHSAVETILGGRQAISPAWMHWSWKDMDVAQVEVDAQNLLVPRGITSRESLEEYAQYVVDFTSALSQQHGRL